MATLDPPAALGVAVTGDNAVQVIAALQVEIARLNTALNQYKDIADFNMNVMRADISGSTTTPSLNDRITHLEGFSVRVEDVQTVINEKMKAELQKSSAVIDEVNKQIATLTGAGGQLYNAVEQLVSQSFAAVYFKVNGVKNEMTTFQQRVKSIEDSVAPGGVITPGVGGGHRN